VNIGLHVLNALLIFAISRRIAGLALPAATLAGALFAVLPIQAETVVWITGRVDSLPTFFYLSSFLAFSEWRRRGSASMYWLSVGMCFCALFSKQTAITLVVTLVLYDILIERMPITVFGWIRSYTPFVLLTVGYLGLRYLLFSQTVRGALNTQTLFNFGFLQARHLQKLLFGTVVYGRDPLSPTFATAAFAALVVVGVVLLVIVAYRIVVQQRATPAVAGTGALLLYFGPIWWLVSTGPTAAANYESARHLYLGSVGFAIAVAVLLDWFWRTRYAWLRYAALVVCLTLVFVYASILRMAISEWRQGAFLSERVTLDSVRIAAESPPGSLIVIDPGGIPTPWGNSPYPENFWAWAMPFALQPPFASSDLTKRVFVISPVHTHCCDGQWFDFTRNNLIGWSKREEHPPVISLHWNLETGELLKVSDKERPRLREQFLKLPEATTREELAEKFYALIHELRL
jgi:hypothetical protein